MLESYFSMFRKDIFEFVKKYNTFQLYLFRDELVFHFDNFDITQYVEMKIVSSDVIKSLFYITIDNIEKIAKFIDNYKKFYYLQNGVVKNNENFYFFSYTILENGLFVEFNTINNIHIKYKIKGCLC